MIMKILNKASQAVILKNYGIALHKKAVAAEVSPINLEIYPGQL